MRTEAEANAVRVGNVVYSSAGRGVEDESAAGAGRRTIFLQANIIGKGVAFSAEGIAVDLASIEIDQAILVGVLQLQDGLLDFSSSGADLDGDAVADR